VKEPLQNCHSIFRNVHLLPLAWILLRILLLLKSAAPSLAAQFLQSFLINDLKRSLNDPIRAKVLSTLFFNVFYDSFLLMDIDEFWLESVCKLSLTCYQKFDPINQSGWNTRKLPISTSNNSGTLIKILFPVCNYLFFCHIFYTFILCKLTNTFLHLHNR